MPKKPRSLCVNCSKSTNRPSYKYCSNKCQREYQYKLFISEWVSGKVSGLQSNGVVSKHVKRYLRNKFKNKCCLCGWSQVNIVTGQVPLVADHIDGNWRNNLENNLRLICPNCDSLSATYASLNKGNGREQRTISNRVQEARVLVKDYAGVTQLAE